MTKDGIGSTNEWRNLSKGLIHTVLNLYDRFNYGTIKKQVVCVSAVV